MSVVLIVILIAGGIGGIIAIAVLQEKKRTAALQAAAVSMNFTFVHKPNPLLLDRLKHFHLFSLGHGRKVKNMLQGRANDLDVLIFDYRYTTGGGKHSHTWRQSVILFEWVGLQLPGFVLRPEQMFHRIGQVFGYQDIDFDTHPEFSKQYLLRGDDENAIREAFTPETLSFYETDRKLCTEARGGQLIHYRSGVFVKPEKIADFIKQGVMVLTLFRR